MLKCQDCPSWDNDLGCTCKPSEITDVVCLLRHIAITLNYLVQRIDSEIDDGEEWKLE